MPGIYTPTPCWSWREPEKIMEHKIRFPSSLTKSATLLHIQRWQDFHAKVAASPFAAHEVAPRPPWTPRTTLAAVKLLGWEPDIYNIPSDALTPYEGPPGLHGRGYSVEDTTSYGGFDLLDIYDPVDHWDYLPEDVRKKLSTPVHFTSLANHCRYWGLNISRLLNTFRQDPLKYPLNMRGAPLVYRLFAMGDRVRITPAEYQGGLEEMLECWVRGVKPLGFEARLLWEAVQTLKIDPRKLEESYLRRC